MSNLHTKQITINGNSADLVATKYVSTIKNKDETLVSQTAVEDFLTAYNKLKHCDFEFNNQHTTNIIYDNCDVKLNDEKTRYLIIPYNIPIAIDGENFLYLREESLKNVTCEEVYLPYTLTNEENVYTFYRAPGGDINKVSDNIKKIIVSEKINDLVINITTARTTPLTIVYPKINLTNGVSLTTFCELYTSGTYLEHGLGNDVSVNITVNNIHLSSRFFNDERIEDLTAGACGSFSSFSGLKIYVQKRGLITDLGDADLLTALKTILKYTDVKLE